MKKIGIISSDPEFLGGVSLYTWNVVNLLKKNKCWKIFWIYRGNKDRVFKKEGINLVEFKGRGKYPVNEIILNRRVREFLEKNDFDVINSHATGGYWMKHYLKKGGQKIIHTYHGSTYHFFKNHFRRPDPRKKIASCLMAFFGFLMERAPWKKADKLICVSEHLKKDFTKLYGNRENVSVIRTGVDFERFNKRDKKMTRKRLRLNKDRIYGLYVGRGGFWTKGLDKVIDLSRELYRQDDNFRLLVIGGDYNKVKHLINEKFIEVLPIINREKIKDYYSSSNLFFSMSRCEGGAPTMVTSEAMASGCLVVTDKEANQEIFEDEKNGLIIKKDYEEEAKRILRILKNKKKLNKMARNSLDTIKDLSLEKWAKKYLKVLNGK